MVVFNEEKHEYTSLVNKEKYISATTLIHKYSNPFDSEYWAVYKALEIVDMNFKKNKRMYLASKNVDYILNMIPSYIPQHILELAISNIKAEWKHKNDVSKIKGTAFHQAKENQAIITGKGILDNVEINVNDYKTMLEGVSLNDLKRYNYYDCLPDGYYSELLLFHHEYKVAGTSDVVIIETDTNKDRWVTIDDFKGFSLDTPIATPTGWVTIEDIKKGDEIFDGEGKITKVKNTSELHHNPCYKITFDTNDELVCDHEHKWVISLGNNKKMIEKEMTTEDLVQHMLTSKESLKIKCTKVDLPEAELPLDPYILGLWLADGNRTCGTITCNNPNIIKEIENRGFKLSIDHNRNNDKCASYTIFGILSKLRGLNLIGNKHIPIKYLRASYNQRLDLLRGFMDGDGFFHRKRKRCVMNTTKEWQAKELMSLISSLGFKPTYFKTKTKGFGKENIDSYHVCFSPSENPFKARNTDYYQIMQGVSKFKSEYRYIKSIEKIPTVTTKCLEVESETHTYLAGHNFIKTHNTNKEIKTENRYDNMLYPVNHLPDCNHVHYNLQTSLYAYMLECMGFKVKHTRITWIDDRNNQEVPYLFDYKREEVINILQHYSNTI